MDETKQVTRLDQKQVVENINKMLHDFCSLKIAKAKQYDSSYQYMWEAIDEYLLHGGKRIRPYLTLLAFNAFGGEDINKAYPAACSWELLHAGLLVHDDIIDRDTVRHGALNITGVYQKKYGDSTDDAAHFASSSALLAGDLLISGAQEIILQSDQSALEKVQMCVYLTDALFCEGGGELLDVESILGSIADSSPEKIARYKTASYSFEYPLLSGAYLAGASESELTLLQLFGEKVGITFQIIDDILGVFGDTNKTGKPNDSDIKEKKRTALIKATLDNLSPEDGDKLERLFSYSHHITDSDVVDVRKFIDKSGAKDVVMSEAKGFAGEASEILKKLSIDDYYKMELQALVDKLLIRIA